MVKKSDDIPTGGKRGQKKPKSEKESLSEVIHEELENYKFEIRATLGDSIREEFERYAAAEIRRANRRRHWSSFLHDLVIIAFVAISVYFGYRLYELKYFSFQKNDISESSQSVENSAISAGPVKDSAWYLANYQYLFNSLNTNSNADEISAYYLYSGDFAAEDIDIALLLSMSYGQIKDEFVELGAGSDLSSAPSINQITVPSARLSEAFSRTFGTNAKYQAADFTYGCLNFTYDKTADNYIAENVATCRKNSKREIIEKIEKIYAEGEMIYVITNAGVYNKEEKSFYNFNDLFHSVASGVPVREFSDYAGSLNRYQYQFIKSDTSEDYYFSKIVKLR